VPGAAANLVVGTLFAWSLVAQDAVRDVGAAPGFGATVFGGGIVVFAATLLCVGPAGRWAGPRQLLWLAAVTGGGGLLLAGSASQPLTLWCGVALLFGAANGLAYGVSLSLAARVRRERRGLTTGVVVAAYATGPVVLGLAGPAALRAVGWRPGLVGLGAVVAGTLALAGLLAPSPPRPGRRDGARARPPSRPVRLLWAVFAGGAAPGLLLFAHAVPLATQRHLPPAAAGLAVSALAAGNLAGRVVGAWWSDRVGRVHALRAALTTAAVSLAGLVVPVAAPLALSAFLLGGVAYGAVSSVVPVTLADRVGAAAFPTAYGRVFTGWCLAGLVAPVAGEQVLRLASGVPALLGLAALPLVPAAAALERLARSGDRGPSGGRGGYGTGSNAT
jgi:MFS family permease